MNKFKQAIAWLINRIETMYHATRFFLSIITSEFPNDRRRMDGRPRNEPSHLRNADSQSVTTHTDRSGEGYSPSSTCGTARTCSDATSSSSDDSRCGVLGGLNRDLAHRLGYSYSEDASRVERAITKDLQNRKDFSRKNEADREWDLLEPAIRQAIILDVMRSHQAQFEEFQVFAVHEVVVLCDRADVHWDIVFDDLVLLLQQRSVVLVPVDQGRIFFGLFWGLA